MRDLPLRGSEKFMEVVIGFMADSCREQDDWDVLGQLFVEPCKLVFVVGVKEVLSVVHTEEFGVTWIDDSFALEHCIEAPNDSSGKGDVAYPCRCQSYLLHDD